MNVRDTGVLLAAIAVCGMAQLTSAAAEYTFDKLGVPCWQRGHRLDFVTPHPDGYSIAWAPHETPDFIGLLGVRLDTGEVTRVPMNMHGRSHVTATFGLDGHIYAYAGSPDGHFMRYTVATGKLEDLGVPAKNSNYFAAGAMGPDGRFYVGTYPSAVLVSVDTQTGEIASTPPVTDDVRNRYIFPSVAISADGIVYCPVGLNHQELYAHNPKTGESKQILPEDLGKLSGSPRIWRGADGNVYASSGSTAYLCQPDRIVTGVKIPGAETVAPRLGDETLSGIAADCTITFTHTETGETRKLKTEYEGRKIAIYCVGTEHEGKIWGGSMFPANVFSYDPQTGEFEDYGRQSSGTIQVYDVASTPRGLLLSSYVGAFLNLWDPGEPRSKTNPFVFERGSNQERPIQWTKGPDGHYYIGTRPIKGHVGGGLARVNVEDPSVQWWIDPIGPQSVMGAAPVPETGELLCTTSHYGGTSSRPTEPEGFVFLWNCKEEKVTMKAQPVPGSNSYSSPVRARTGIIYGTTSPGGKYFAFDPVKRETVFVGDLPGSRVRFPGLHSEPVGPDGLIYGLIDDAVWAIDPADHSAKVIARHPSINSAHGFMVTDDGTLYYGSGPDLWRCKLVQ